MKMPLHIGNVTTWVMDADNSIACICRTTPEAADVLRMLNSHAAAAEAMKKAMHCLTEETEEEWSKSQAYEEAPYHFLFAAILEAQPTEGGK